MSGCCSSVSCCSKEEKEPKWKPVSYEERGCTDCFCLLTFFIFWFGMLVIAGIAAKTGDPMQMYFGSDHKGVRCGMGEMVDLPKTYYPRISQDILEQATVAATRPWKLHLYGLCVPACPQEGDSVVDYYDTSTTWHVGMASTSVMNRCLPTRTSNSNTTILCADPKCDEAPSWTGASSKCYTKINAGAKMWEMEPMSPQSFACSRQATLETSVVFATPNSGPVVNTIAATMQGITGFVRSCKQAKEVIGYCGILLAIVASFGWIVFLRFCAGPAVYLMIVLVSCVLIFATFLCSLKSGMLPTVVNMTTAVVDYTASDESLSSYMDAPEASQSTFQIATLVFGLLTLLFFVFVSFARRNINISIALIQEASYVISDLPSMMFFPMTTVLALLILVVYWVAVAGYLATAKATDLESVAGDLHEGATGGAYGEALGNYTLVLRDYTEGMDMDEIKKILGLYHLFGFLWTSQFIQAIGACTIAGAVCNWYFDHDYEDDPEPRNFPTMSALWIVLRFHMGSMAFGSLIIAITQAIQLVLEYIDQETKDLQESNYMIKLVMKCTKCCMYCFEQCIKFITGFAYIYIAMEGTTFCTASWNTFKLIGNYPTQVAINAMVNKLLYILQTTAIPVICGVAGYIMAADLRHEFKVTPLYPALVCTVVSYGICRSFGGVYESTTDTLFVCAVKDVDMAGGKWMSDGLREAFELPDHPDKVKGEGEEEALKEKGDDSSKDPDAEEGEEKD